MLLRTRLDEWLAGLDPSGRPRSAEDSERSWDVQTSTDVFVLFRSKRGRRPKGERERSQEFQYYPATNSPVVKSG